MNDLMRGDRVVYAPSASYRELPLEQRNVGTVVKVQTVRGVSQATIAFYIQDQQVKATYPVAELMVVARPLAPGTRVQLHPATDDWMRGARYGTVVGYGRERPYKDTINGRTDYLRPVKVKLDRTGVVRSFHPNWIQEVD